MTKNRTEIAKLPIKKIIVSGWREVEDLVDPESSSDPKVRRRKDIHEKHPGHAIEFWLDDDPDEELKLMGLVHPVPSKPTRRKIP